MTKQLRRPALLDAQYGLTRRFAAKRLFHRMLSRQHIRVASIPSPETENIIYRALHTCSHCTTKPACTRWLDGAEPAMRYVRFCPNAESIETLRIMAR